MLSMRKPITHILLAIFLAFSVNLHAAGPTTIKTGDAIIWSDPGNISSKDLSANPWGEKETPQLPVKFLEEDKGGHNSKFDVEDSAGTKWKAKLGIEAQPETVASRILWSVGYFTNENYLIKNLEVQGLPAHLRRGQGHVTSPNHLDEARLQKHEDGEKKTANWSWKHNPFVGQREFNGLRVMMALLGNWDLKNENNAIYTQKDGTQHYLVTDLGTAFGPSGNRWTEEGSKNNLKAYRKTKFITKTTRKYVSFSLPRYPPFLFVFNLPIYVHQVSMRWVGNKIPREDAKWIGSLLAQLSTAQIESAFRAGGYTTEQASAFAQVLQARIAELNRL